MKLERDSGGVPVPAMIMPLRYAFEGMLVAQATRNPFELERIRMQRKIERAKERVHELDPGEIERFEMYKEGLRRLLASGAKSEPEARELVERIHRIVGDGNPAEVSAMQVWPEGKDTVPTYTFYLNERIDLLVREAETFRNDYRNKKRKHVFLALEKPVPFYDLFVQQEELDEESEAMSGDGEVPGQIETMKFCGIFLLMVSLGCTGLSAFVIGRQNRSVK